MTREQKLAIIWKKTPRDYRGKLEGERSILTRDRETGGSVLCKLNDLSDEAIDWLLK